jgi:hypothetical protein
VTKTVEKKFVLMIMLIMQQLYCLYTAEDNSSKNIFNFATNFCAGVTSRFYEILFRGFSLCANSWIFLHILALFSGYI